MKTALHAAVAACVAAAPSAGAAQSEGYECLMAPHLVVAVGSPVTGLLATVDVDRGDGVRAGQVIATLESSLERSAVDLARTRAEFEERRVERNRELDQDELISEHDRDEMRTQSLLSKLELAEATARLEMRTIRSPIDGVVVERSHSPGELLQETPIATLAQIDPLNVEVVLPVAALGSVKVGDIGQIWMAAPVEGTYQAKVVIVDQVIDAASGTFGVRLELPNPGGRLPAGLRCRASFGRSAPSAAR